MAAEVAVFMAAAVAVASMGMEVRIAAAERLAKVAGDLMAEEGMVVVAHPKPAAVQAHPQRGRRIAARRIFVPPSTMANGIRSATAPVPLDPRVQAQDAIPQVPRTRPSWLATLESPMAVGTLLADQAAHRPEAQ
jgi:hypothetical protein